MPSHFSCARFGGNAEKVLPGFLQHHITLFIDCMDIPGSRQDFLQFFIRFADILFQHAVMGRFVEHRFHRIFPGLEILLGDLIQFPDDFSGGPAVLFHGFRRDHLNPFEQLGQNHDAAEHGSAGEHTSQNAEHKTPFIRLDIF